MSSLIETSRETAEELLARRHRPMSYQERVQYALDLVDMHMHEENPVRIDECLKLYTEDALWDAPARGVSYRGRQLIKENYVRIFDHTDGIRFEPIERFASPDRVFDDMWVHFTLTGDAFDNCPFPVGTKVKMRLLHNFHIRDGMIERETGYEIWLKDS
jgi:SnoaL-like domain